MPERGKGAQNRLGAHRFHDVRMRGFRERTEVAAVLALHPRIQACRKAILDGLLGTMPSVVPVLAREFAGADDDTIAFVQRKLSWGERVRRTRDRYLALQAELQTEERRIVAGLERSRSPRSEGSRAT